MCTYTLIHADTHVHTHSCSHRHMCTYTFARTHTRVHTHSCSHRCMCNTHSFAHTHSCVYTHTREDVYIYVHTHTHTQSVLSPETALSTSFSTLKRVSPQALPGCHFLFLFVFAVCLQVHACYHMCVKIRGQPWCQSLPSTLLETRSFFCSLLLCLCVC